MTFDEVPQEAPPAAADVHEPTTPKATLRFAVLAYVAGNLAYGVPMLLWPDLLWGTIAGADGEALEALRSLRWAGGVLVALGVGGILVFLRPHGQRTFVTTMALQLSLVSGGIVTSIFTGEFDNVVAVWFRWLSGIVVVAATLYLWFARFKAREILGH